MLRDIHLSFGGTPLLDGAELLLSAGERLSLVGRNGSGKSTLLKIAAGFIEAERGERFLQPGVTVRYLSQEPDLTGYPDALAYVEAGLNPGDDPYRARYLLEQLGVPGGAPEKLSGGEQRRAALARALAPEPDLLMLDEPTNHLDLPAIDWLEQELKSSRSALVLISHDRRFLETLSNVTVWLDQGRTRRLEKGFAAYEDWRDTVIEEAELQRHKQDRKIVREEDWLTHGVSGRRKRNQKRLGNLHQMRQERREQRRATGTVTLTVTEGAVSGRLVAEAEAVSKSFDGRTVIDRFSTRILRGDRVGFVGPNGAGKTTLLNLLTGKLAPDTGSVRLGSNLQTVVLDQKRASLDPRHTLAQTLTGGSGDNVIVNGKSRHVAGYMRDFLFQPEQANTPISRLSGGERARLILARALAQPSNLLILDEPTNDLDLETLDLLQEMLADYPGTVLLVSHDRDFLDRVTTSIIAFEGEGRWAEYPGGYSDMVAQRGHGVQAEGSVPAAPRKESPAQASSAAAPRRKLSFKDKHALDTLPATMERLAAEIAKAQARLADPGLYSRDPTGFAKASAALAEASTKLAAAEEQWLELEMAREKLEG
jgi:ATP-binding cassette subfamily F protein uup